MCGSCDYSLFPVPQPMLSRGLVSRLWNTGSRCSQNSPCIRDETHNKASVVYMYVHVILSANHAWGWKVILHNYCAKWPLNPMLAVSCMWRGARKRGWVSYTIYIQCTYMYMYIHSQSIIIHLNAKRSSLRPDFKSAVKGWPSMSTVLCNCAPHSGIIPCWEGEV